jgi:DNA-binding NarL/FixJ family response regulator
MKGKHMEKASVSAVRAGEGSAQVHRNSDSAGDNGKGDCGLESESAPAIKRILLVEDHPLVRLGLREIIRLEPDLAVVAEASGIQGGIQALREHRPDLMVLDLSLADGSGFDLLRQARDEGMKLPVLVVSMHDEILQAPRVLKAGAQGYLMKQEGPNAIVQAIRRLLLGGIHVSARVSEAMIMASLNGRRKVLNDPVLDRLSPRETDVFRLIGQGLKTALIAERLHISVKTVETHRSHMKDKLKLPDTTALLRLAIHHADREAGASQSLPGPSAP